MANQTRPMEVGIALLLVVGFLGFLGFSPLVVGDFRTNSMDSRLEGPVHESDVAGEFWFTIFARL